MILGRFTVSARSRNDEGRKERREIHIAKVL
jgi:hypothetical protein